MIRKIYKTRTVSLLLNIKNVFYSHIMVIYSSLLIREYFILNPNFPYQLTKLEPRRIVDFGGFFFTKYL